LVLELSDDLVEDGVFLVSLGLVLSVDFALVLEIGDGLLEGVFRLLKDGQSLGLLGKGGLDLSLASVGIEGLALVLLLEVLDFSLGGGEPLGELPGGFDLVGLKVGEGFLDSLFKVVKNLDELLGEGSSSSSWGRSLFLFYLFLVVLRV